MSCLSVDERRHGPPVKLPRVRPVVADPAIRQDTLRDIEALASAQRRRGIEPDMATIARVAWQVARQREEAKNRRDAFRRAYRRQAFLRFVKAQPAKTRSKPTKARQIGTDTVGNVVLAGGSGCASRQRRSKSTKAASSISRSSDGEPGEPDPPSPGSRREGSA